MKLSKWSLLNPAMQLGMTSALAPLDVGKTPTWRFISRSPQRYAVVRSHNRWRVYFDRQRDIAERSSAKKKKGAHRQTEKISGEETGRQETGRQKTRRCRPAAQNPLKRNPK